MLGLILLAIALTTGTPQAATQDTIAFDGVEATARAEAGRVEIAAELAGLSDHAWAGSYFWGDGLGANVTLHLAPAGGFVFEWHGCLGLYGRNYGPVRDETSRVVLEPELPNKSGAFAGIDEELVPVAWGARRYLVPPGLMGEFCNAVNGGSEPREGAHGLFLLRAGHEKVPVSGRPTTPEGDIDCLLDRPIEARVVVLGARRVHGDTPGVRWYETTAVLDAGREQGVWVGMRFFIHEAGHWFESGKVTRVAERSSEAVFSTYGEHLPARAGWQLSTRPD
jgi:hypothetical protein